jgi:hypothetical protein
MRCASTGSTKPMSQGICHQALSGTVTKECPVQTTTHTAPPLVSRTHARVVHACGHRKTSAAQSLHNHTVQQRPSPWGTPSQPHPTQHKHMSMWPHPTTTHTAPPLVSRTHARVVHACGHRAAYRILLLAHLSVTRLPMSEVADQRW